MILEEFSILTLNKSEPDLCLLLSENLELLNGSQLMEFLETSV